LERLLQFKYYGFGSLVQLISYVLIASARVAHSAHVEVVWQARHIERLSAAKFAFRMMLGTIVHNCGRIAKEPVQKFFERIHSTDP